MFTVNATLQESRLDALDAQSAIVLCVGKNVLLADDSLPALGQLRGFCRPDTPAMLAGTLDGGIRCYGITLPEIPQEMPEGFRWSPCREAFLLSSDMMNAICRGRMLGFWRRQHRYCGGCKTPLSLSQDDLALICPACGERYYPQIAPAVITAITRNHGKELLMAHNKNFAPGVFSLIAGFVEAGETLEQAVQREIREETGISVKNITYLASQPWPYPNALMFAFKAEYESGEAVPDGTELLELGWYTRENHPQIPAPGSIAHHVIQTFMNTGSL